MSVSPDWLYYLVLVVCALINLVGLVGMVLVFFPGLTVAWFGQLIWVIFVGFNKSHEGWQFGLTIAIFVVNTLIMLVGSLLDNILGASKTRKKGVPWWEIFLTMIIMILAGIAFTPLGGLALSLGTLFLIEYFRQEKNYEKAWESTKALAFGYGTAAIIRFFLCLIMIVLWVFMVVLL